MTITKLVLNFRQALIAVLPAVENVGIPWRRPDAYDDWDSIASALYNALVVEVIHGSLGSPYPELFRMPDYDLLLDSYDGLSFLKVRHPVLQGTGFLFHSFGTRNSPLDIVELRRVSETAVPFEKELELCSVEGAEFKLRLDPSLKMGETLSKIRIAM